MTTAIIVTTANGEITQVINNALTASEANDNVTKYKNTLAEEEIKKILNFIANDIFARIKLQSERGNTRVRATMGVCSNPSLFVSVEGYNYLTDSGNEWIKAFFEKLGYKVTIDQYNSISTYSYTIEW